VEVSVDVVEMVEIVEVVEVAVESSEEVEAPVVELRNEEVVTPENPVYVYISDRPIHCTRKCPPILVAVLDEFPNEEKLLETGK